LRLVKQTHNVEQWFATVIDSVTGEQVFEGEATACNRYAREWNAGNPQAFMAWQSLAQSLIKSHVLARPLPWSIQFPGVGYGIVAQDGTTVVNVDDIEVAAWVIQLAEQYELELYPDGRK
jgi:hypothetical protein